MRSLHAVNAASVILPLVLLLTAASTATAQDLTPPEWSPEEAWDSMPVILEEQRNLVLDGPVSLVGEAAENIWRTHHTSGIVILPTPGIVNTEEALRMHVKELGTSIGALEKALRRDGVSPDDLAVVLDAKVRLEQEVDFIQTIGKWTREILPDSPEAQALIDKDLRAPFLPISFRGNREPNEDIFKDVIGPNECHVVVKEIHGLKAKLRCKVIPIWVEPWWTRRTIVGYKKVWWIEYVPAEFIKRILTCNRGGYWGGYRTTTEERIRVVEEPQLLDFVRYYPGQKGHYKKKK